VTRKSLLPGNATAWERANAEVSAANMLRSPVATIPRERDPLACDAAFVAPLGWERSVHFWNPGDDAGNRARIASSFADHLNYGCPATLENEISLDTGLTVTVREFFEVAGLTWPDFVVDIDIEPGDPAPNVAAVYAAALTRKPARDVLAMVRLLAAQPAASVFVAAATCVAPRLIVLPLGGAKPDPQIYVGAGTRVMPIVTVLPLETRQ
jgi:P2-related tail formation protein